MFKKIAISAVLISSLVGCSNSDISEVHQIEVIEGNDVYGGKVKGTGEGIYYTKEQFIDAGIKNVAVGDKVKVTWTKDNFDNENWNEMKIKKVK